MRDSIVSKCAFCSISSVTHDHWSIPRKSILAVDLFPSLFIIHYLLLISNPQGGQSRRKNTLARLTRPIVSVLSTSSAPRWPRFKKAGKGLNFHKCLWIESETQGNVKVHLWPSFDFQLLCLKVRDRLLNAHNSLDSVGRSTNNVFAFRKSKYQLHIYIFALPGLQNWRHLHHWYPRQRSQCDTQVYTQVCFVV